MPIAPDGMGNPLLKTNPPIGKEDYQPTNWVVYGVPLFPSCKLAILANAKGQRKFEKRYDASLGEDPAFYTSNASVGTTITIENKDSEVYVVSVELETILSAGPMMHAQLAGVLSHEASHVCDNVFETVGERLPGTETRAYLQQWLVEAMCEFYYLRFESLRQYHEH